MQILGQILSGDVKRAFECECQRWLLQNSKCVNVAILEVLARGAAVDENFRRTAENELLEWLLK